MYCSLFSHLELSLLFLALGVFPLLDLPSSIFITFHGSFGLDFFALLLVFESLNPDRFDSTVPLGDASEL